MSLDLSKAGASRVRAGMNGKTQGKNVVIQAFDFVPKADLAVEFGLGLLQQPLSPGVVGDRAGRCARHSEVDRVQPARTHRGRAGSARAGAIAQAKNPARRGVTVWVETDGTVYWAVPEDAIPTHGDGANRNDNKYIDNGPTFRQVLKGNSIGVEFSGNFPDVARPASAEQIAAWRILVRVLQARYGIPSERVYAHNWIDYKDARYCEGCDLATLARGAAFSARPAR